MSGIVFVEIKPDQRKGRTGMELLRAMMAKELPAATIGKTLNFTLESVEEGKAVFVGEPTEAFLNPLGTVHGGWALTLIDSACGCAAHTVRHSSPAWASHVRHRVPAAASSERSGGRSAKHARASRAPHLVASSSRWSPYFHAGRGGRPGLCTWAIWHAWAWPAPGRPLCAVFVCFCFGDLQRLRHISDGGAQSDNQIMNER